MTSLDQQQKAEFAYDKIESLSLWISLYLLRQENISEYPDNLKRLTEPGKSVGIWPWLRWQKISLDTPYPNQVKKKKNNKSKKQ